MKTFPLVARFVVSVKTCRCERGAVSMDVVPLFDDRWRFQDIGGRKASSDRINS